MVVDSPAGPHSRAPGDPWPSHGDPRTPPAPRLVLGVSLGGAGAACKALGTGGPDEVQVWRTPFIHQWITYCGRVVQRLQTLLCLMRAFNYRIIFTEYQYIEC